MSVVWRREVLRPQLALEGQSRRDVPANAGGPGVQIMYIAQILLAGRDVQVIHEQVRTESLPPAARPVRAKQVPAVGNEIVRPAHFRVDHPRPFAAHFDTTPDE